MPELPDPLIDQLYRILHGEPAARAARIQDLCAEHPAHAAAIRAHHAHVEALDAQTRSSLPMGVAAGRSELVTGQLIGPYRILTLLGEGGMGSVYLAEQEEPVRRRVACKVIKLGMDSVEVLRRFEVERQALAVMNHTNIARVFDAGTTDRGQPFFAMEYVSGLPLTTYADRHKLTIEQRIALFQAVCAGVQHAHQKGVIHRDLKPGNILVAEEQNVAIAKIIDFGLARATDHMLTQKTMFTRHGQVMGTPEYMSPEQGSPAGIDIDTRTDVYSLGMILFELLVGALPFSFKEMARGDLESLQKRIREEEPPRPSAVVSSQHDTSAQAARARSTTPGGLLRTLRNDLDWIVLKAIEKDRNRRYGSAAALAVDLQRYLDHEPVEAGPPTSWYRMRKLLRRYRAQFVATALVLLTALAGAAVSVIYWQRAVERSEQLERQEAALRFVTNLRKGQQELPKLSPPWPDKIQAIEAWLGVFGDIGRDLPAVEAAIATLEGRVKPEREQRMADGEQKIEERGDKLPWQDRGDAADRFVLEDFVQATRDFRSFEGDTVSQARLLQRWAVTIQSASIDRHRDLWERARAAIAKADGVVASDRYKKPRIDLAPQLGLVPIGMNPVTKLWEFYHLRSAWIPERHAGATDVPVPTEASLVDLEVNGETGIVFVLVPGGDCWLGSQSESRDKLHYTWDAKDDETDMQRASLAPFFLARHELTKGQWKSLSGEEPSYLQIGFHYRDDPIAIGYAHPVEYVSWVDCDGLLERHGLALPTEAQWEYASRAGMTSPWQAARLELAAHANLGYHASTKTQSEPPEPWADGFASLAPVGRFEPNNFGLFDMHGNVLEWCRDVYYYQPMGPPQAGDGLRDVPPNTSMRVYRGGSFEHDELHARSGRRHKAAPTDYWSTNGVRAARPLLPRSGSK